MTVKGFKQDFEIGEYKLTGKSNHINSFHALHLRHAAVDCGDLQVSNGTVDLRNGTRFPAVAIYTCNRGYNISDTGDIVRACLANGTWSGTPIECIGEWTTCIMYHWYIDEKLLISKSFPNCNCGYISHEW